MKRFEKYRAHTTCGGWPERIEIHLGGREVGELYIRDGEMALRAPHDPHGPEPEVYWSEDIRGWGSFDASERDHYMHEAIRRLDPIADPDGDHGVLDPDEPVPEIAPVTDDAPEM